MRNVGWRLREIRKRLNMSQEQFAQILGLKRSSLGKHERNESFPTGKMLSILVDKYNISMDYLLCKRGTLFYKEKEGKDIMDEEIKEMLALMSKVPLVRHSVMSYYQRFKLENQELIEKELTQKKGKS